jgi:hypothetical protein
MKLLSYPSPLAAVFLRILAWEVYVAGQSAIVRDVKAEQVAAARFELGLPPLAQGGGAADDFLQKLRDGPEPKLTPKGTPPRPAEARWKEEWRLHYLPAHSYVRWLSQKPIVSPADAQAIAPDGTRIELTLRDPALPHLEVWNVPIPDVPSGCANRRGVYALRAGGVLYIGQSSEFSVRAQAHKDKHPDWCIFASPADYNEMTLDTLSATEALMISFWNEICSVENQKRGSDQQPRFHYLQQAILLTPAMSSALLWFARQRDAERAGSARTLPFKPWTGHGWPECYQGNVVLDTRGKVSQ